MFILLYIFTSIMIFTDFNQNFSLILTKNIISINYVKEMSSQKNTIVVTKTVTVNFSFHITLFCINTKKEN